MRGMYSMSASGRGKSLVLRSSIKELDGMMNHEHLENVFYEVAFERLAKQGHCFSVLDVTDLFSCELDTVEDFENARQMVPAHLF